MQYLVLVILAPLKPQTINELVKFIASWRCNLVDSYISTQGQECSANMLITGQWNDIAKLEAAIPLLETALDLKCLYRRTELPKTEERAMPYSVYITAPDSADIMYKITEFLSNENLAINHIKTNSYIAPQTQAPMLSVTISISFPMTTHIADMRERFLLFCDDLNLDIMMEPQKN